MITNTKLHMGFGLVQKLVTLNGIMAIVLRYFAQFGSFCGQLHKSRLIGHQQIFYREMSLSTPTKHDRCAVLFAIAERLVFNVLQHVSINMCMSCSYFTFISSRYHKCIIDKSTVMHLHMLFLHLLSN